MGLWRTDAPVLGEDGQVLVGGFWPTQKRAWESQHFAKIFCGGYGSGKSYVLAKRAIASALHNAPVPILLVSPSFRMAKRTILPAVLDLLDGRKIVHRHSRSDSVIEVTRSGRTGKIWLASADVPETLKGSNVATAMVDEMLLMPWSVIEILLARIRDPGARLRELFCVGTPEDGVASWLWDLMHGEKKGTLDLGIYTASTRENLALPKDFVSTLEAAYDEKTRAAYIEGKLINMSSGQVYHSFDPEKHVARINDPAPEGPLYVGIDFNHTPLSAVIFWLRGGHLHVTQEMSLTNADTLEAAREVYRLSRRRVTRFYPDPSGIQKRTSAVGGTTDFSLIQKAGQELRGDAFEIRARRRTPPRRDRFNAANAMFAAGNYTIDPSCTELIKCFTLLTYDNYGGKRGEEDYTHLPDAATYVCEIECPVVGAVREARRWYN